MGAFLTEQGTPTDVTSLAREHVEAFLVHIRDTRSASTAETRYRGLKRFLARCEDEGEIERSPMYRMHPPRVPEVRVDVPSTDDLKRLLAVCGTNDYEGQRDTAIILLFFDAGLRLSELTNLTLDDVDLSGRFAVVLGKGDRYRHASFGVKTAKAIDRYLRIRRGHASADLASLWLGLRGPMTTSGVRQILWRRSTEAGIRRLHPHQLRHYFAQTFSMAGGSEGDLQSLGGWKSRQMLASVRVRGTTTARPPAGGQDPST